MTKKQAERLFKAKFFNSSDTWTDKRIKWNDFVEHLRRDGQVTERQAYGWGQPAFVNPPKKRTPKTCSFAYMLKNCGNQLNAEDALIGRWYHKVHGWITCQLDHVSKEQVIQTVSDAIGGRKRSAVTRALRRSPQHWALRRMFFRENGTASYCAGQDYPYELNQLRKYLYNL